MENLKRIIKKLQQKDGLSYPFVACMTLVLLIMVLGVLEIIRFNIISANVRNKFESVIISEATDNYSYMYQTVRDGYASSYQYDEESGWQAEAITKRARIINSLNDYFSTGEHGQVEIESVDYRINLHRIAPVDAYNATQYNLRGELVILIPYRFLWSDLPPARLTVQVRSTWRQLF